MSFMTCAVLTDSQVGQIHESALRLLEHTGCRVQHDGLLARLAQAGARVDAVVGRVRWPETLLTSLLECAPAAYAIRGVENGPWTLGKGQPGVLAITNDPWILDSRCQKPRHPCLDDVRRHTIIAQQLDCVKCVSCMDYPVTDFDDALSSLRALETHVLHHAKHYAVFPASLERLRLWRALGQVLNGGDALDGSGLMSCAVAVLSPLTLSPLNAELLLAACECGMPILPTVCPMAGATAPYTLAGTLLLAHCENLTMAAVTQLLRPGHPFLYGIGPSVTNLRTGHDRYYTLDKALWKAAGVQLARHCGLPGMAECGGAMPGRLDLQTGAESLLFMLAARGSGADLLSGLGSCFNGTGLSAEMMVIQHEWLRAAEFLDRGIAADPARLAIDNMDAAGPGGDFLTDTLTLEYARGGEFFETGLFDYGKGKTLLENAHEEVERLAGGFACPLPEQVQEDVRRFFYDNLWAKNGM